jgi:RNase P/RNase MRP subunit p30
MVFNDSNIFEIQLQLKFKVETIETTDAKENDNIIKEKDLINYLGGKEKDKNSEKQ